MMMIESIRPTKSLQTSRNWMRSRFHRSVTKRNNWSDNQERIGAKNEQYQFFKHSNSNLLNIGQSKSSDEMLMILNNLRSVIKNSTRIAEMEQNTMNFGMESNCKNIVSLEKPSGSLIEDCDNLFIFSPPLSAIKKQPDFINSIESEKFTSDGHDNPESEINGKRDGIVKSIIENNDEHSNVQPSSLESSAYSSMESNFAETKLSIIPDQNDSRQSSRTKSLNENSDDNYLNSCDDDDGDDNDGDVVEEDQQKNFGQSSSHLAHDEEILETVGFDKR
ncbi:hypothetical protein SSS_05411 [Sarcoptes scabiei]|nr:hypothetical protein SSS_05411 [Sarcoptes scabiei]